MERSHDIDQRLTDLEIKASFTEDLLDQLDQVIVRQQQRIDTLVRQIGQLQIQSMDRAGGVARNMRDELPPHY